MKIAIITGGETGEREVSIRSAENVRKNIDFAETETFVFPEDESEFTSKAKDFDLAIPVIHGLGGEDGTLQEKLETLGVPFIFSEAYTHSIGIDKLEAKKKVREIGIESPADTDKFPAFAKPRFGGSSVASKLCKTESEFEELKRDDSHTEFIKEEPIKGREFTVGIIQYHKETFALPVVEIIPKEEFFDFESKYNPAKLATEICPAKISPELTQKLQKQALDIHKYLKARHLSRSDFIVTEENKIYFLEINTIPGLTSTSLIPKMLKEAEINFRDVLKEWCFVSK